jgi:flavin-dependent dehydrogenase
VQQLASQRGARLVRHLVTNVYTRGDSMTVECADGSHDDYELVVIASGINSQLFRSLDGLHQDLQPPGLTKTFICEFKLGRQVIRETLGPSMHVFLLDIPRLEFAALIPKGDYVTLVLLGDDIDEELMTRFFSSPEVGKCFPGGVIPCHVCHCYPRINISTARPTYGDRVVMIGDSGTTRLFKDGIGAAYRTAKAAARTVVFHGVSADDFRKHYWPLCRKIDTDNRVGKLVFAFGSLVQRARFARRGVLRMVATEQRQSKTPRRMSSVLWDLFSGSAPYTNVFMRTLHPAYIASLVWNLLAGSLPGRNGAQPPQAGGQRT